MSTFDLAKLHEDLEYSDTPPITTDAHKVYRNYLARGLDPMQALQSTQDDHDHNYGDLL